MRGGHNKLPFNERFFEVIDTEEKAYWLGFIAADGNLHKAKRRGTYKLTVNLNEKDEGHLEKLRESMSIEKALRRRPDQFAVVVSSKHFETDLIPKGITERKTMTLKPPNRVPEYLIRHWIRGYFDGDGSVYWSKDRSGKFRKKATFAGTLRVCQFIKNQLDSHGNIHKNKNIFVLRFQSRHSVDLLMCYLYYDASIYMDRKFDKFRQRSKY